MAGERAHNKQKLVARTPPANRAFSHDLKVVHALVVTPEGRVVLGGDGKKNAAFVCFFDLASTDASAASISLGIIGCPQAITPDGRIVVVQEPDGGLSVVEVPAAKLLCTYRGHKQPSAVACSVAGTVLSAGEGGALHVWDAVTGEAKRVLRESGNTVQRAAISADGGIGLSAASQEFVRVWDIGSGRELRQLPRFTAPGAPPIAPSEAPSGAPVVALAADGRYALTGERGVGNLGEAPAAVRLWDAGTGELLHEEGDPRISKAPTAVAFSLDGQRALAIAAPGRALLTAKEALHVWRVAGLTPVTSFGGFKGGAQSPLGLTGGYLAAFGPGGRVVVIPEAKQTVRIYEVP